MPTTRRRGVKSDVTFAWDWFRDVDSISRDDVLSVVGRSGRMVGDSYKGMSALAR